jgi:hypothetical protein
MPLSQEEIDRIKTNIESDNFSDEVLKPLADLGIIFRTPKMETAFKTNYASEVINRHDRDAYSNVEASVLEATGVEKQAGEKASEYIKRAFTADKTARETIKSELETLKTKVKDGDGSAADKQKITQLETLLQSTKAEFEGKLTEREKQILGIKVENALELSLTTLKTKLKTDIAPELMDDIISARLNKFNGAYTPKLKEDGKTLVFLDKEGNEVLNSTTFKAKTADELLGEFFVDLLEVKREQKGGGGQGNKGNKNEKGDLIPPAGGFKTRVEITKYLKEHGVTSEKPEYNAFFTANEKDPTGKLLPLR